jgi:hypothetical protein
MIPKTTLQSFFSEMTKISAGIMLNVGPPIRLASGAAKAVRGAAGDIGHTFQAMAHPGAGMKAGWKQTVEDVRTGHPVMTGLFVAGTGYDAYNAMKKQDPSGENRSRLARLSQAAGSFGGGVMGAPHGLVGGVVGSLAGEQMGRMVGRGIDAARGRRRVSPQPQAPQPQKVGAP